MFLRWQHRKTQWRHVSDTYVYGDTAWHRESGLAGRPVVSAKATERLKVALVESSRVNGRPRTRVIAYLGSFDPREPVQATSWTSRSIMARMRALDIPLDQKARFLKEIEARGVEFDWPASLAPVTPEEQLDLDAKEREQSEALGASIAAALAKHSGGPRR